MPTGTLKKVFMDKGFAFIVPDEGGADLFAPMRNFVGERETAVEGSKVSYDTEVEDRTNKMKASSWSIVAGGAAAATLAANPYGAYGAVVGGYTPALASPYGTVASFAAVPGAGCCAAPCGGCCGMQVSGGCCGMPAGCCGGCPGMVPGFGGCCYGGMPGGGCCGACMPNGGCCGGCGNVQGGCVMQNGCGCQGAGAGAAPSPSDLAGAAAMTGTAPAAVAADPNGVAGAIAAVPGAVADPATAGASAAAASAPSAAAPAGAAANLPAGWEMASDPASGNTYYFNRSTGQTSWTVPTS
eukprot:TRINITY_DN32960_c0_g1_i1.p1 TRINITY_DN32960_c0_g1~~TRINITY_DN32960_c0_g1_i1.p1  ORF type:complete len:298 (+),score=62.20 TRINITY_DN32960_c0_g1_i1:45-938(+)